MNKTLQKRRFMYIQKPQEYEICCDKCGGSNLNWSEWDRLVWCYDCQIDTRGSEGVFGGPIPITLANSLGMSFDRYDLETKKILKFETEEWRKSLPAVPYNVEQAAQNNAKEILEMRREKIETIRPLIPSSSKTQDRSRNVLKIIILLFILLCLVALLSCDNHQIVPKAVKWVPLSPNHLELVCIEGHTYYIYGSASIAPKLYANGTPVPCQDK